MLMPGSNTYFLKVSGHVSLKVATKDSFRAKNNLKTLHCLGYFSITKTEECDQKEWSVSDKFGITMPFPANYFFGSRCKRFSESSHQRIF